MTRIKPLNIKSFYSSVYATVENIRKHKEVTFLDLKDVNTGEIIKAMIFNSMLKIHPKLKRGILINTKLKTSQVKDDLTMCIETYQIQNSLNYNVQFKFYTFN